MTHWIEETNWDLTYAKAMDVIANRDEHSLVQVGAALEAKEYWERHPDFGRDERSF